MIFDTIVVSNRWLMATFKSQLGIAIKQAVKELYKLDINPVLEHPTQDSHGDYSTNVAMVLAKRVSKKPLGIAKQVAETINNYQLPIAKSVEAVPPGFTNFWLSREALVNEVNQVNKVKEGYGGSNKGKGKTVVIDYSSPNVAKRFGIGHLRSTVIGQALYNLYQFLGYKVVGDNHLGDWGTQFGVIIAGIKSSKLKVENLTVGDLEGLYVEFYGKAKRDPKLMDGARAWFKKLEEGDSEARRIWEAVIDVSMQEFDRVYDLLGVKIDHAYGESFYEDKVSAVIEEVRKSKLSKKSKGAEIVEFPELPPVILVKSDGATTYFTRDLATVKYRIDTWDPQVLLYEVGVDQKLHFQQVFETAKLLGWTEGRKLTHVAHGLIRFKRGKLSTRRGQTVRLEDVLDEAIKRARKIVDKSETGRGLSDKEKGEIARAVGIGAVKYFDLLHHPTTDIIFDWDKLFVLEGNSAPYLQYTYARVLSVLRKAQKNKFKIENLKFKVLDTEMTLLRYLYRFPEVVEEAVKNSSPNLVCNYLFELAQHFNSFYAKAPIIGAESKEVKELRLALTAATGQVLGSGLTLLGIETPERL